MMRWPTDRNGDPAVIAFWESRASAYHGWEIVVSDNPRAGSSSRESVSPSR